MFVLEIEKLSWDKMIHINPLLREYYGTLKYLKYSAYPQSYYAKSVFDFLSEKENITTTSLKRAILFSIIKTKNELYRRNTATIITIDVDYQRPNKNEAIIKDLWDEEGLEQLVLHIGNPEKRHQLDLEQGIDMGKWYKVTNVHFIFIPRADASVLLGVDRYNIGPQNPNKENIGELVNSYGFG